MPRPRAHPRLTDRRWLVRQYVTNRRSSRAIADELGCSIHAVQRALQEAGVRLRGPGRSLSHPRLSDPKWLAQWPARTLKSLAAEIGCGEETIRRALKRHGITRSDGPRTVFVIYPQLAHRAWLTSRYAQDGTRATADEVGCTRQAVITALHRHGIPVRAAGKAGRPPGP